MVRYIIRRLISFIPTIFLASVLAFSIIRLVPGDPVSLLAGPFPTPEIRQRITERLGLDLPMYQQYINFLKRSLLGDFGVSPYTYKPVLSEVLLRVSYTALLTAAAIAIAVVVGFVIGVTSALKARTLFDNVMRTVTITFVSLPIFWFGFIVIIIFGVMLKVLPTSGAMSPQSIILPAITLSTWPIALISRMVRSTMLEALNQDYITMARSTGLPERQVVTKYALKNSLIPTITVIGSEFGSLICGAVTTETVFAWPGIGRLLLDSFFSRDYLMMQGAILTFVLLIASVNLILDISYAYIDPRIRYD